MADDFKKIQKAELVLLEEFIEVCKKYNLKYFVRYGTALGAVRHKGFIPWDDDIDIDMPRIDYALLLSLASEISRDDFYIDVENLEAQGYLKIVNKNIELIAEDDFSNYLWIDITPLDYVADNIIIRKIWLLKCRVKNILFRIAVALKKEQKAYKKWNFIKVFVLTLVKSLHLQKLFHLSKVYFSYQKELQKYNDGLHHNYWAVICGYYWPREIMPVSWYGEGVKLPFENIEVVVPQNYHAYLTQIYGDYMTLPPEEDRRTHGVEIIKERVE